MEEWISESYKSSSICEYGATEARVLCYEVLCAV